MIGRPLKSMLGVLKTKLYRTPRDRISLIRRWGLHAFLRLPAWQQEMQHHAEDQLRRLPAAAPTPPVAVTFMTGRKHWYQTAFCAWTLQKHIQSTLRLEILDDGTLTDQIRDRLHTLFPQVDFVGTAEAERRVEHFLPVADYPHIHSWRKKQLLFRKLTDVHAGQTRWKLFLDSDMLFFAPPTELINWWNEPNRAIFQTDCFESYGYSRPLIESLLGKPMIAEANIGIFSLRGDLVDWDQVERWLTELESREGSKYNVTQCITTMLMSSLPHERLDAARYHVFPGPGTPPPATGSVLQHYVADSKPWYFRKAWRIAAGLVPNETSGRFA